ncbi:unnamed protein product [Periconia digitata]|uniref:Uncharacterized protein n=1 Tax=Periconia digitata TaxID=1303443 RepID=A0A9W4U5Q7_9PLEO|nr:unnamed protein product [Periconia digitata]
MASSQIASIRNLHDTTRRSHRGHASSCSSINQLARFGIVNTMPDAITHADSADRPSSRVASIDGGPSSLDGLLQLQRGGGPPPLVVAPPPSHPSISPPAITVDHSSADGAEPAADADAAAAVGRRRGPATSTIATPTLLPPTLTPATTTRQAISLGALSTLWGPDSTSNAHIVTSTQESPVPDLTATSSSSVPSTTTTLTNVLPPTQSAALRALNAPAFQSSLHPPSPQAQTKSKPAKSTSSRTTLSSQPVVVRTYSGSRHKSHHSTSSAIPSPRYINMNRPSTSSHPNGNTSALSAGLADARYQPKLPNVESFSFSAILRAVDPEIRDAIDAIAEICARSRYSLADEYDAHLPPQGEITEGGARAIEALTGGSGSGRAPSSTSSRGRLARIGQGWSTATAERTLVSVPEASSSSERSYAGSQKSTTAGKRGRSQSAYGSLKSVISGGNGKVILSKPNNTRRKSTGNILTDMLPVPTTIAKLEPLSTITSKHNHTTSPSTPAWSIFNPLHQTTQTHTPSSPSTPFQPYRPAITITTSPRASHHLSLDTSCSIKQVIPSDEDTPQPPNESADNDIHPQSQIVKPSPLVEPSKKGHIRNTSGGSTFAALTSWVPLWPGRTTKPNPPFQRTGHTVEEQDTDLSLGEVKERLRGMLKGGSE